MKNEINFEYPNYLQIIFDKLNENKIKPIIVGGYIRDYLLNISSKDIDIELYGINSFEQLEKILEEFGEVNSVGKSFGVCKLSLKNQEIDFSLPRIDNKISSGHRGFDIIINQNLDFKTASSRRDFTINAIGYDVISKKILDPFNGLSDLKNKTLKAVNIEKFIQDPLRVFRAVGFYSRFKLNIDKKLFKICKKMCDDNVLDELPQERIFNEIKKIILKSPKPSI
ncbi:MAG: CCA tRNA nucleotidyltransferase, partial [Sulfurimonas sp.]|nr:CCA tRNA nucleotidyltransferase [Sulfurimonas sp.]